MREMQSMHPADKEQFCEHIYDDIIVETSSVLQIYEEYAEAINVCIPISCYTNFRDALFHFRRMVSSIEEREIEEQAFAIKEHLSRTLTDASSSILFWMSLVTEELLKMDSISLNNKQQIRVELHNIKNLILLKRMNGMMISQDYSSGVSHTEIHSLIEEFYTFLQDNCSEQFAECSHYLSEGVEENTI